MQFNCCFYFEKGGLRCLRFDAGFPDDAESVPAATQQKLPRVFARTDRKLLPRHLQKYHS